MNTTKDSIRFYQLRYNPSSALIIINQLLTFVRVQEFVGLTKDNPTVLPFILPCLHIYHLGMSLYDRHHFDSKIDNASKFFKDECYFEDKKYCFIGVKKHYGFTITDFISVVGFFTAIFSVIPMPETSYLDYVKYAIFGLVAVDILFGSPDAYFEINYNISSPEIELFSNSKEELLEINYDLETTVDSI